MIEYGGKCKKNHYDVTFHGGGGHMPIANRVNVNVWIWKLISGKNAHINKRFRDIDFQPTDFEEKVNTLWELIFLPGKPLKFDKNWNESIGLYLHKEQNKRRTSLIYHFAPKNICATIIFVRSKVREN